MSYIEAADEYPPGMPSDELQAYVAFKLAAKRLRDLEASYKQAQLDVKEKLEHLASFAK